MITLVQINFSVLSNPRAVCLILIIGRCPEIDSGGSDVGRIGETITLREGGLMGEA